MSDNYDLIDSNLTDSDRVFIRKLEKFKDDLVTLLEEGVIRDIILVEMEKSEAIDFYSDRNKRQLNPKNPNIVARVVDPKAMYEKHARELRAQYGIRSYKELEEYSAQIGSDENVCQEKVTSFIAYVTNLEFTRAVTRSLYQVCKERFSEMQKQTKEDELDFMLLFSSIFGITVQFDKTSLDKKKAFIRMIL